MSTSKKPDTIDLCPDDWEEVNPASGFARDRREEHDAKHCSDPRLSKDAAALDRPDGLPQGYELLEDGLYWTSPSGDMKRIGSWLRVAAVFKEATGRGWGKVIEVRDPDGVLQLLTVLNGELTGQWPRVMSNLADLGFEPSVDAGAKRQLQPLLMSWTPESKKLRVRRSGWVDGDEAAFVLGVRVIGSDRIMADQRSCTLHYLEARGTPLDWQETVGRKAMGNPLLVLGISLAFFGPVQHLLGRDLGGGIHLVGSSSSGKSTIAECAVSVWGGPRLKRSWNATINGLEAIAAALNGTILVLDEIGEASARQIGETIYMLANETGRSRMTAEGTAREASTWSLPFLSTGETSLAERLAEAGKSLMAGQTVRLIEVAADGRRFRAFDELHGAADGAAFARTLKDGSARFHGTAGVAFLERVVGDRSAALARIKGIAEEFRSDVMSGLSKTAEGTVLRVLERFAFIAAAGELATEWGVTGWKPGEARLAVRQIFEDWLDAQGDEQNDVAERHLERIRRYMAGATDIADLHVGPVTATASAWQDGVKIYIPTTTWQRIHGTGDDDIAARALKIAGLLQTGEGRNLMARAPRAVPGRPRVYALRLDVFAKPSASEEGAGGDEAPELAA